MTYNIAGIFDSEEQAQHASKKLEQYGFVKAFRGYYFNTNFQPESLIEDHFIEGQTIYLYTPNINRAYKALKILKRLNAEITNTSGLKNIQRAQSNSNQDITYPKTRNGHRNRNRKHLK